MRVVTRDQFPHVSVGAHEVILFGEMHTPEERDEIERLIKRCHAVKPFNFLLSEEVGPYETFTNPGKLKAIKDKEWSISPRSYELGIALNVPVIGIDIWDKEIFKDDIYQGDKLVNCSKSFTTRETHMKSVILQCAIKRRRIAVIVGDSHLRQQKNPVMGEPSVLTQFFDRDFLIVRSPISEVE